MSEKRSWDIQPKRRVPAPVAATQPPQRVAVETRRSTPAPRARVTRTEPVRAQRQRPPQQKERPIPPSQAQAMRPRKPVPKSRSTGESLKDRRKRERKRALTAIGILFIVAVAVVFGSFWLKPVRIQNVMAAGPDSDGMQSIAEADLSGTYSYLIPRNSILFFPEEEIRSQILKQYPDISAVTISRSSLDTISIASIPREAALTWCGATYQPLPVASEVLPTSSTTSITAASSTAANDTTGTISTCYSADAQGIVFAPVSLADAASSDTLRIYAPLADDTDTSASPLGKTIAQANLIPNALQFVKAIRSLGVPIVSFVIRGDEADLYAQSGTRITYVLGHEEVTAQVAEAAFPSLNLNDGSLEYVDLRFEGKAYFKKVGAGGALATSSSSAQ